MLYLPNSATRLDVPYSKTKARFQRILLLLEEDEKELFGEFLKLLSGRG